MFRFIGALIFTILFLIVSIPFILVFFLLRFICPKFVANASQTIVCGAFKVVYFISGVKLTVLGKENLSKDTPVLLVPNHRSIFDIIVTYPECIMQTGYVAKKETSKIPVFSLWMRLMNCQFLDRKNLRKGLKVINKSAELIQSGKSMCIFPEGTRNKGDEPLLPFHDGSLKIAEKAQCPVVPVAINNTEEIFEKHFPKIRKAHVIIEFCKPIDTTGLSKNEMRDVSVKAQEAIKEAYIRNQKLI